MVLPFILEFILFTGVTTSFVSVLAQGEGGDTGGMLRGKGITVGGGMTEDQTDPNGEGEVDLGTGGP